MSKLSTRIAAEIAEWEVASRRNKTQRIMSQVNPKDVDIRRQIIIGGIVCDFMPFVLSCQPKQTEAENLQEFKPLCEILEWVAQNRNYIAESIGRDTNMLNEKHTLEGDMDVKK